VLKLQRHRGDAVGAMRAVAARERRVERIVHACDGAPDPLKEAAKHARDVERDTARVAEAVATWRSRLARPEPFRYRGAPYADVMTVERHVLELAAAAPTDMTTKAAGDRVLARREVVRWLQARLRGTFLEDPRQREPPSPRKEDRGWRPPASCDRDEFREMLTGKTMKHRHRRAR